MANPSIVNRIGVLTGGGDCPGLNAVIRAVVKTAHNVYGWEVYGIEDGFEGLIQPGKVRPMQAADVRGILPRGGTILGTTNRANPFHYEVDVAGKVKVFDVSADVVRSAHVLGLDALIVIGGDGSLKIAHELSPMGLNVVGVPKTIDNDLQGTQVTFGFDTAVNTAMDALDKLHTTAESHHRVIILEVMGRDAGWIALQAGLAGGADVILIPEIPYDPKVIVDQINARSKRGAKFSIIVVAEGAHPMQGETAYLQERDLGGARRLGGAGQSLADQIKALHNLEVRVTVLGHLQRGGSPTSFDRLLGSRFGTKAVHMIAEGLFDHMVALRNDELVAIPLAEAINTQKLVPMDSDLLQTAFGLDVSLGNTQEFIQTLAGHHRE